MARCSNCKEIYESTQDKWKNSVDKNSFPPGARRTLNKIFNLLDELSYGSMCDRCLDALVKKGANDR